MLDQQYFSGSISISDDALISQGAMQYSVSLEEVKDKSYGNNTCPNRGKECCAAYAFE